MKYKQVLKLKGKTAVFIDWANVYRRKCDFDMEICMSVYAHLAKKFDSFIFFSGDGDFEPLYQYLISLKKQVMVIYEQGHLGKEVWAIKKGLFKTRFSYLGIDKIIPPVSRGA